VLFLVKIFLNHGLIYIDLLCEGLRISKEGVDELISNRSNNTWDKGTGYHGTRGQVIVSQNGYTSLG